VSASLRRLDGAAAVSSLVTFMRWSHSAFVVGWEPAEVVAEMDLKTSQKLLEAVEVPVVEEVVELPDDPQPAANKAREARAAVAPSRNL